MIYSNKIQRILFLAKFCPQSNICTNAPTLHGVRLEPGDFEMAYFSPHSNIVSIERVALIIPKDILFWYSTKRLQLHKILINHILLHVHVAFVCSTLLY
jgi:hypothetical protein